eukprot:5596729-Lingulodinium_polyedra.AAC.1
MLRGKRRGIVARVVQAMAVATVAASGPSQRQGGQFGQVREDVDGPRAAFEQLRQRAWARCAD